jgi:chemotaxis protein CheD
MAIGGAKDVQLITYALGSCIGLTAYDPVARLGGMLHFMLPEAGNAKMQPEDNELMYAATGIPKLVDSMVARGAREHRLILCASGGARTLAAGELMSIGEGNRSKMLQVLEAMGMHLLAEDTRGSVARTMSLDLQTGQVCVRIKGRESLLWSDAVATISSDH